MSRGLCFEFGVLEKERLEGISWQIADGRWSIIRRLAITKESIIKNTYASENLPSPLFAKEG